RLSRRRGQLRGRAMSRSIQRLMLMCLACSLLLAGCGGETASQDDLTSKYLSEIGQAYLTFLIAENRHPESLDVIRKTVHTLHLADYASDPELVMRSPRYGQPFVVIMGAASTGNVSIDRSIIWAYEQTGVDGQRYVLKVSHDVELLTEEEFARSTFAA